MSRLTYDALITELFPRLTGGIRWGLERTRRMLAAVGNPHEACPALHVGGTNGKGSVAATMASVLGAAGLRTGLYTSPHLCSFRERIRIDGESIGEAALLEAAERLWPAIRTEDPSFFEATTAIAFLALAEAGVDVAVIEVGLGGRLDATNVIRPEAVALTNVALDHVQLLGPTLSAIANEKAGILKAGVPAVTTETGDEALAVFRARAREVGAPLTELRAEDVTDVHTDAHGTTLTVATRAWGPLRVHTPLSGMHQATNAALAAVALERLPERLRPSADAVQRGIAAVRWPGRLQVLQMAGRTWVFDVAHNVAAVHALAAGLSALELPRPLVLLAGVLGDKDWRAMLRPLYAVADAAILTVPPTAPRDRRWEPAAVIEAVPDARAIAIDAFDDALRNALRLSAGPPAGTIVVTGSFHTVGDVLIALGRAPDGVDTHLPFASLAV